MANDPMQQAPEEVQETVNLQIPRAIFDQAKAFVKSFGQTLEAADAGMKAQKKGQEAQSGMEASLAGLGGLEGLGEEMTMASDQRMGAQLPPM